MSDKQPPTLDDIDDFLLRDSLAEASTTDLPRLILNDPVASVRTAGKLERLNHRITHISGSLGAAVGSLETCRDQLDDERECMAEFGREMLHWEALMNELEEAIGAMRPERAPISTAGKESNSGVVEVAVVSAAKLDAEVAAEAAADANFTRVRDESDECLNGAIGDNDATINRDEQALLLTLVEQESRIKELERQLQELSDTPDSGHTAAAADPAASDQPYVNRLIVAVNSNENIKFPLTRNIMTIGREPHNDIHIRSRFVSRFHARIVSDRAGSTIEDLDSRNGLRVNSRKVERRQPLRSGDIIDFGRMQFKFIDLMEGSAGEGRA